MKQVFLLVWLLVAGLAAPAQNLVLNPSFEQYRECHRPGNPAGLYAWLSDFDSGFPRYGTGALNWYAPTLARDPFVASLTYHVLACNKLSFLQAQLLNIGLLAYDSSWYQPRTGRSYITINTYQPPASGPLLFPERGHTYAQTELAAPLRAGCTYRVSFYARLAWGREFNGQSLPPIATDNLGAYFSPQPIIQTPATPLLLAQPQVSSPPGVLLADTLAYTRISGTFVAQGGERFLTLGNFRPDAATTTWQRWANSRWGGSARYAIDDVSVEAVPPAGLALELGPDRWLGSCSPAPALLTAPAGFLGYRWNTGQTTASISVSQPGRYVVTADFGCGQLKDSVELRRYNPALLPLLAPPLPLCPGQSTTLTAAAGFSSYQWADGFSGPSRTLSQPGRYRLTATTADGCPVRDSVDLFLLPPPLVPAGWPADTLVCAQEAWRLTLPPPPAGTSYEWSTGATGPSLLVPAGAAGAYTLTVRNRCQTATAVVRVRTQDCAALLSIPNIITPNDDGRNDRLRITAPSPRPLRLQVFNRWGQLVFEAADYQEQWPASPTIAAGMYYYLVVDEKYGRRYQGWIEVVR